MELTKKKCAPCEGGTKPYTESEIQEMLPKVPGWEVKNGHLTRHFEFKNFKKAIEFINKMAELAEDEGHHPDFCVHYNKIDFEIWTHAINGLSENDFILAANLNKLAD